MTQFDDFQIIPEKLMFSVPSDRYCGKDFKKIKIRDTVEIIRAFAFENCKNLESVFLPDSVREIAAYAFKNCEKLREIHIPKTVTKIEEGAFQGTAWIKNLQEDFVIVGDGILFLYQGKETEVVIPSTVNTVASEAFQANEKITSVVIPDSVSEIDSHAFKNCKNLTSVKFNSNFLFDNFSMYGNSLAIRYLYIS